MSEDNYSQENNKIDHIGSGAANGNTSRHRSLRHIQGAKNKTRRNRMRENQDKNRSEELALAVSIILANLSCDEDFLKILLGVKNWR